jgi:hypothetical protein
MGSSAQILPLHEDPGHPVARFGVGAATDPTHWIVFTSTSPRRKMEWRKKGDKKRFRAGHNGDKLITHFQCNLCTFRNVQRRDPVENESTDDLMMACIRQANLNLLWKPEECKKGHGGF